MMIAVLNVDQGQQYSTSAIAIPLDYYTVRAHVIVLSVTEEYQTVFKLWEHRSPKSCR